MKILVVGDSYYSAEMLRGALAHLAGGHELEFAEVTRDEAYEPQDESERLLREFDGRPDQVRSALTDHEVLVVHGAPVSRAVLAASPALRLVLCLRGGPVNIDVAAAESLGIEVVTTPGKNAPAVADLTIALAVMLARGLDTAVRYLKDGHQLTSTFDGSQFFGSELAGKRLGLIGFGKVGQETCARALAFGMNVHAYDPYVDAEVIRRAGAEPAELGALIATSDFLSLHARQTKDNHHLIDAAALATMPAGAFLINTAREGLLDEQAALDALASGRLAGLGVDVFEPGGPISHAVTRGADALIALPHIGGATNETLKRAALIATRSLEQFTSGVSQHTEQNGDVTS